MVKNGKLLSSTTPITTPATDLSALLISLLKGVLYRDGDERLWGALINLQARVRDYVILLHLELVLVEAEGYAFFKKPSGTKRRWTNDFISAFGGAPAALFPG